LILRPKPFDLHRTIEDLVTMIAARAYQKDVEINFRYDPDLPKGYIGDAGRIRQILVNIVGNAVKFTNEGHILIDVRGHSTEALTHLEIEVSDTGIGIPAETIGHVFNEFEQSYTIPDSQFEGTGLGLSISSRLVRMMGGAISVRSEAGKGSVFSIRFALEQTNEVEPPSPANDQDLQDRKVLIVDDMEINRTILSQRLRNWGVSHRAVASGSEALDVLQAAEKSGDNFDAIIMDYHMPSMNGCELAARIRTMKNCRTVPIILLSSVDVTCESLSGSPDIFEIYLLKPVRSDTLKAVLANAVRTKGSKKMPEPERAKPMPTKSPLSGKTVLIAEDNKTNQLVLQTMLKILQVNVITAENGLEALQSYVSKEPDLVLMDMAMPVMDGLDATREIRELERKNGLKRVPIIALTANAMSGDRDTCLAAGMDDYLSKPVIKSNLALAIEKWTVDKSDAAVSVDGAADQAADDKDGATKVS
jgi:two-component system sensor histidine kinase/response regulator